MINTEGDPSAGMSHGHAPTDRAGGCAEGIGNQNVQTLFLTPKGQIFHTASGFRNPQTFMQELQFADKLFARIQDDPHRAAQTVVAAHRQLANAEGVSLPSQSRRAGDVNGMLANMGFPVPGVPRGRNVSRQPPRGFHDIFAAKTQRSKALDYEFAMKYPLMPIEDFQANPRSLVGNGSSAFVSGNASGGRIGGNGNNRSVIRSGNRQR